MRRARCAPAQPRMFKLCRYRVQAEAAVGKFPTRTGLDGRSHRLSAVSPSTHCQAMRCLQHLKFLWLRTSASKLLSKKSTAIVSIAALATDAPASTRLPVDMTAHLRPLRIPPPWNVIWKRIRPSFMLCLTTRPAPSWLRTSCLRVLASICAALSGLLPDEHVPQPGVRRVGCSHHLHRYGDSRP